MQLNRNDQELFMLNLFKKIVRYVIAKICGIINNTFLFFLRFPLALWDGISFKLRKHNISHAYDYLKQYKDCHAGERAFFVGTGPSLTIQDVESLKGELVFGVNSLIDSADQLSFPITYYCLADTRAVDLFYEKVAKSGVKNIFVGSGRLKRKEVISSNTMIFPDTRRFLLLRNLFPGERKIKVSDDISNIVYDGGTVIFCAMQIAAYMGIREMYLLGVDCNYAKGIKNFNEFRSNTEIQNGGNERTQLGAFFAFKEYADRHGIKVYNSTRGGMLEAFPRVNLEDVLRN